MRKFPVMMTTMTPTTIITAVIFVLLIVLRPAGACTFAGSGVPAPCTFTMEAMDTPCTKNITTVTVTSLMDNNKINESATYVDLGAKGHIRLIAMEDGPINTGQSMKLYAVRDGPLPAGASVTVVASGISDTKPVGAQGCNCSIILANTTAYFDPESGLVSANGTIRGGCILSGMVFAVLNKTTGLASERLLGFPPGNTFLVPSARTYTSYEASRELQVLLLAYGYNGALGAAMPPMGSFRDFEVSLPKSSLAAEPGKPVEVTVSVTNFGNEPDTYTIAAQQVPWDWSSERVAFSLGPNSASNRTMGITSSQLTFSGTQNVLVSVTSASTGKTKTASLVLSPSALKPALQPYVYPPRVILMGRPFNARAVLNATAPSTVRYFFYTEPFVKTDSSEGTASAPAGLSSLGASTAVRDICALPDSAKFLRKMNVYWSVMRDVLPDKDPVLIKKVLAKIDSYKGSVTTPSLTTVRGNVSAIASSLGPSITDDIDARIAAMLPDIDALKWELNAEENKTLASPKFCRPVANADLVIEFISYSDASESLARSGIAFASGEVLNARLLDEAGNVITAMNMRPGEVRNLKVEITNGDTETRQFTVDVVSGVLANFISLAKNQLTIGGGQIDEVGLAIQMPTVISGTKNATFVVSSSPYIKSVPIVVTMSGPELSGQELYTLEPGTSATISLSLRNNDKAEDTYSLSVSGAMMDGAKWFTVPQSLKVGGGKDAKIEVKANAPATTALGTYNFTFLAYSQVSGAEARFAFALSLSGEFKALRTQASQVEAIQARIKERCPGTQVNAAVLKDARALITAGRLSEAKSKLAFAGSEAEKTLADCTSFKMPFGLLMFVLGGLALAYFWFFVIGKRPATPQPKPGQQGGGAGKPGGIELPPTGGGGKRGERGGKPTSEEEEETWI